MNFSEIAEARQSCRRYDPMRDVEPEKLARILASARLAPSACNGQPYFITVCRGEAAKKVAAAVGGMGMNRFTDQVPAFIVICEQTANLKQTVATGIGGHSFAQMDIGIAAAHMMLCARTMGIDSCIIGWFSDKKLRELLDLPATYKVRLVLALGYGKKTPPRNRRR